MCDLNDPTYKAFCGLSVSTLFSKLSHNPDFLKKAFKPKKCRLIFYTNMYESFLILSRIQRDKIKIYIGHQVTYILSCFNKP